MANLLCNILTNILNHISQKKTIENRLKRIFVIGNRYGLKIDLQTHSPTNRQIQRNVLPVPYPERHGTVQRRS